MPFINDVISLCLDMYSDCRKPLCIQQCLRCYLIHMDEHYSVAPLGLSFRQIRVLCVYLHGSTSYLVEVLQTLLDLSQDRVWDANFDFWVLPLGMQTISHNSARITEKRGRRIFRKDCLKTGYILCKIINRSTSCMLYSHF